MTYPFHFRKMPAVINLVLSAHVQDWSGALWRKTKQVKDEVMQAGRWERKETRKKGRESRNGRDNPLRKPGRHHYMARLPLTVLKLS